MTDDERAAEDERIVSIAARVMTLAHACTGTQTGVYVVLRVAFECVERVFVKDATPAEINHALERVAVLVAGINAAYDRRTGADRGPAS